MQQNERGQALLVVLMVVALLVILGTAGVTLASYGKRASTGELDRTQALYVAEAGVERALAKLKENPRWRGELGDPSAGIEKVTVVDASTQPGLGKRRVEITSTGSFRTARKTLKVNVLVVSAADLLSGVCLLPPNECELKICGNVTVKGKSGGNGAIIVRGNVTIEGNPRIQADVYVSGAVYDPAKIQGSCYQNQNISGFPALDEAKLKDGATILSPGPSGTVVIDPENLSDGVYFVDGDINIKESRYSAPATIVATGDINVTGDLKRRHPNGNYLLTLIALGSSGPDKGNVSIKQGDLEVDALILAQGNFKIQGNSVLYGAVVAQGINEHGEKNKLTGTLTITCDSDLNISQQVWESLPLRIESWKEL